MELLRVLPNLNRDQLLYICQRDQIPISSPSQEFMLRADIERAIYQRNPYIPRQNTELFTGNSVNYPLVRNILLELGVKVYDVTPKNVGIWAQQVGLPWDYLNHDYITAQTVLAIYLWERRVPVPEMFLNTDLGTHGYFVTLNVFRNKNPNMFSDETIEEYLFRTGEYSYDPLTYQDLPTLIYLADSISAYLRDEKVYFKTKIGCIDYIFHSEFESQEVKDWVANTLVNRWINAYPERESLIGRYLLIPDVPRNIFYGGLYSLDKDVKSYIKNQDSRIIRQILRFPPCRIEEEYLRAYLESRLPSRNEILKSVYSEISRKYQTVIENYRNPFSINPINLDLRTNRAELIEILRNKTKKWGQLSGRAMVEACGWVGLVQNDKELIKNRIEASLEVPRFELITDGRLCSNSTTMLGEETSELPILIAYGTFGGPLICYSAEELEHAFIATANHVEFRRPENPRSSFTRKEVEDLNMEIGTTNFGNLPTAHIRNLQTKIQRALFNQVGLETFREIFQHLPPEEMAKFKGIFRNLFEAGMYQRRWCGTGPYHMKYAQTRGGNQTDISAAMTPSLNNVRDLIATLHPVVLQLFQTLPTLDYIDNNFTIREIRLNKLFESTINGNFCVAYASSLLIYSGYEYLRMLGEDIPGFDIQEFETESTHR